MRDAPAKTYAQTVFDRLRDEIVWGVLKPGDRLTEQGIAERMGTSQGPVREALAQLRSLGLIVALAHRGTFVSDISTEDARDIYEVRLILEREAMHRAVERMSQDDLADLRERVELLVRSSAENFMETVARDMALHRRIFELSGSKMLLTFWESIEARTMKFSAVTSPQVFDDPVKIAESHYELLDLIAAKDHEALDDALEQHIMRIWREIDSGGDRSVSRRSSARAEPARP
jgi:DNA-binding GntR family transcriptional regulator